MKPHHSDNHSEIQADEPAVAPESKTRRKAAMEALQTLGEKLVTLPNDKLDKLKLPEALLDAIRDAKRITSNSALRRQMQFIGRLMREVETEPIMEQLQRWEGHHSAEAAHFHQLERWRTRLLAEDIALSEFMQRYPQTDSQHLRTLIRNSQREYVANKPPKSSRELFRLIRDIVESESPSE